MRLGFTCGHCGERSTNTGLRMLSPVLSELTYRCSNDACGHVFAVRAEVVRTTQASRRPNPAVRLPLSPYVKHTAPSEVAP